MGVLYDPVNMVAQMFADSRPFSRWLGLSTYNAAACAKRIYIDGIGTKDRTDEVMTCEEIAKLRPYCVIYPDANSGFEFKRVAKPNCWNSDGVILAVLSRNYDTRKSINQHWRESAQLIEPIVSSDVSGEPGLLQMAGIAGYLNFEKLTLQFAGRTPPEEVVNWGDCYDTVLAFHY